MQAFSPECRRASSSAYSPHGQSLDHVPVDAEPGQRSVRLGCEGSCELNFLSVSLSCPKRLCLQRAELSGEWADAYQGAPSPSLPGPLQPQGEGPCWPQSLQPPSRPRWAVRACFLSHQAQGQRWCGVRGTPLAFAVPCGGWRCPSKPSRKLFSCPEVQSPCGCGNVGEAGRARRPPCKPRSYKMHFPAYPSGLSEPLLLAALFIHDRQLINIQAS